MTSSPLSKREIDRKIGTVLTELHISSSDWDELCSTLPLSSPVWPGPDFRSNQPADLAKYIDHTLLKPDATTAQIERLCGEAVEHGFASVCVNSCRVKQCAPLLANSETAVCAVVGFPLGAMATDAKRFETEYAVDNGANEIDMVINIGALKAGELEIIADDIEAVVGAAWGSPVKVILETGMLTPSEIITASVIAVLAKAAFIKTSTGFGQGGATLENVNLMRQIVGPNIGVKASGGIRDSETAVEMLQAGANRLGTSSGLAICR